MSTVTLTMPRLGETMEEGTVSEWLVSEGDSFARGAPLVEFETDKTAVEYPALGSGRLVKTLVSHGDLVEVGDPIAEIDLMGGEDWVSAGQEGSAGDADEAIEDGGVQDEERSTQAPVQATVLPDVAGPVRATPLARRAAKRAGVRIEAIRGTGRRNRIELADVERLAAGQGDAALAAETWGADQGAPVLLVHGFAGDRQTFDQLGRMLGRAEFFVRAIDLPSHGETSGEARTFGDLVDALSGALDPASPVALIAHSLGAAAAVVAASRKGGVSSLTLIAPAGLGLSIDAEFISGMARADSAGTVAHLLRRLSDRTEKFSSEMVGRIQTALSQGRLTALADDICRNGMQTVNVRSELTALAENMPVRILVGTEDKILDWRDALDVSPAIAIHVFAGAGHMPHWDASAEAAAIIRKGIGHE